MLRKNTPLPHKETGAGYRPGLVKDLRWEYITKFPIETRKKWYKRHIRQMYKIALMSTPVSGLEADGLGYYHLLWVVRLNQKHKEFTEQGLKKDADWVDWLYQRYNEYVTNIKWMSKKGHKPRRIRPGYYV